MRTLLILLGLGFIALMIFRLATTKRVKEPAKSTQTAEESTRTVKCHYCGVHVPVKEALTLNARYYCSADHRNRDQK